MNLKQPRARNKPYGIKNRVLLPLIMSFVVINMTPGIQAQTVPPVLEFPQIGLDDTSTYRGYTTRFFRDSGGNTVQISLNQNTGRVMNIWADAANESMSFTARDTTGRPAKLRWGSQGAEMLSEGTTRYVQYELLSEAPALDMGLFILNTMRFERDFGYQNRHTLPFDSEPFIMNELTDLIDNLEQLPANVRDRHLALLRAKTPEELRSRLVPEIKRRSTSQVLVQQPTFDGKNHLSITLTIDSSQAAIVASQNKISIRSLRGQPIRLTIKIGTDSPSLTPLWRDDIFNRDFMNFFESVKAEYDSLSRSAGTTGEDITNDDRWLRFKRLDRQVKSMELLSSKEKLMAGMPNFATYFGRDMMMSALMLEPVWTPAMLEHVIVSVLRKLTPTGEVSHEEGLGGQAIRENAARYNKLIREYLQWQKQKDETRAGQALSKAKSLLGDLQKVTENYRMVDDDFQLPVLTAHYLTRPDIPGSRKRAFLESTVGQGNETLRLTLLLRNLLYVSRTTQAYVDQPVAENLISFPKIDATRWSSGSWRDSGAGYANGRFAMDINAVWVPKALESVEQIFSALREIGISTADLRTFTPEIDGTSLWRYARDPEALRRAIKTWRGAEKHFEVHLSAREVRKKVRAKLKWLPRKERIYWKKVIAKNRAGKKGIDFPALALDAKGRPIPVANTDIATWLFLEEPTMKILNGTMEPGDVIERLKIFIVPYPVGLYLKGIGPVVANDTYASPEVWENFRRDIYHSPRVIWGREVNLLFLGLAKQIRAAYDSTGQIRNPNLDSYVRELRAILNKTLTAVEASGLKHNELWSYRIVDNKLLPARYPTTSDIQLWNLTDLAVQYLLERTPN